MKQSYNVSVNFNTLPKNGAFILAPLDIVYSSSSYDLLLNATFTQTTASDQTVFLVNVYLRAKKYPYT